MSLAQIGAEFHMEAKNVTKEINWAQRQGLVDRFEDQILSELVPSAIGALKTAMTNGDSNAALEVLKGVGLFRKDRPMAAPPSPIIEESLELHVKRISSPLLQASQAPRLDSQRLLADTAGGAAPVEAELVEDSEQARAATDEQPVDLSDYLEQRSTELSSDLSGDEVG